MRIILVSMVMYLFVLSCVFSGMNSVTTQAGGNAAKFVNDGFSIPLFDNISFNGYITNDASVKMFQVSQVNELLIPVVNPGKLALTYTITTDKKAFFQEISDSVLITGTSSSTHFTIKCPFKLLESADKNDATLYLAVRSPMRKYDTPAIGKIRINTKPSIITPRKDGDGNPVVNETWDPVLIDNKATIYWDFIPKPTDTDITKLLISYTAGGQNFKTELPYSPDTKKFGTNQFTTDTVSTLSDVAFTFQVVDDEGLRSDTIGSGDLSIYKSPHPTIIRGTDDAINLITITSPAETSLYVSTDNEDYTLQETAYSYELTTHHTVRAFSKTSGKIDSDIQTASFTAEYTVEFETNQGSPIAQVRIPFDSLVNVPSVPVRDGFYFTGWFANAELSESWDFATGTVSGNMTLYAGWIEKPTGVIEFSTNPVYYTLDFTPSEVTVLEGEQVPITCNYGSAEAVNWEWYVNNEKVLNDISSYNFDTSGKPGVTLIWCKVEINGVLYSGTVRITVTPAE